MVTVTPQMRKSYVVERPVKFDADAFPGLFVFNAQLVRRPNLSRTLETDVLAVSLKEVEKNQLAQAVRGRAVRHA